jgi:hypothetical protein
MSKEIDNALGLPPMEEAKVVKVTRTNADDDFDYARENLYNIIGRGGDAIEDMLDLARASQHPRSYEVLATLLKTMTDANKDLLELQKKKKDLAPKDENGPQTINNNLFVGSTADLQKMLKGAGDDE